MTFTALHNPYVHACAKLRVGDGVLGGVWFTLVALCDVKFVTQEIDFTRDDRVTCPKCIDSVGIK